MSFPPAPLSPTLAWPRGAAGTPGKEQGLGLNLHHCPPARTYAPCPKAGMGACSRCGLLPSLHPVHLTWGPGADAWPSPCWVVQDAISEDRAGGWGSPPALGETQRKQDLRSALRSLSPGQAAPRGPVQLWSGGSTGGEWVAQEWPRLDLARSRVLVGDREVEADVANAPALCSGQCWRPHHAQGWLSWCLEPASGF